ncbi:hypothetical protein [Mycobacterium sp. DBP42]|uniref:hypothetical protein n=1 Tax=Mycobacterium sp. DBP42 TaxID=2545267 RepID=UPI001485D7CF|nr:hypothetical protein [Mycobacterium sp. DBP42]TMS50675.1 hypothetical protein E0T84_22555 [Mycobacterium sp. DBP42]
MSESEVILTHMDRPATSSDPNPTDASVDNVDAPAFTQEADTPLSAAVIRYAYGVHELCHALPQNDVIDISALPADLVTKAIAHGDDLHSADISVNLNLTDKPGVIGAVARAAAALSPLRARAAAILLSALAGLEWALVIANAPTAVALGAPVALGVAALGTAAAAKRPLGQRTIYTDTEVRQLNDATVIWPIMSEELEAYPNSVVLRREWEQRVVLGGPYERVAESSGRAAVVWREPRLVAVANLIARDIEASPAWASELFDVHRVRIDLDQTLSDIQFRAYRIWKTHANLVPPPTSRPDDVITRRNDEITLHAEKAWATLTELVRQLYEYKQQLAPIDSMVREIAALRLSTSRVTDEAVRQLMVDAAGNTVKAGDVAAATVELSELNANLTARLDFLRQALTEPVNILPITAQSSQPRKTVETQR